jgi:hypothetical protein
MAKKTFEINPTQGSLFSQALGQEPILVSTFPSDPAEKLLGHQDPSSVIYSEPGSYVDLAGRAQFLSAALSAFGKRNQRLGFDLASNSRQYSSPIWGRYRSRTPTVQEGAQVNAEDFLDQAKQNFWRATGYQALKSTNLAPNKEINASASKMWMRFAVQYADPEKRQKRDTYKRQLKRAERSTKRIIASRAA